ncbi:MAG: aminodeoxychorismate synthase component I [Acidobacteriaceae bacterium]|nr:aminodeoxychorismate synthase component I [Acidobacteriaceae bacterium]
MISNQRQPISALFQLASGRWIAFDSPVRVLIAAVPSDVHAVIADVERLARDEHLHAIGFLTYEAGAAFGLAVHEGLCALPLAWFALFESGRELARSEFGAAVGAYEIGEATAAIDRESYRAGFARIRAHLAAGDTYQANYTFKTTARFSGDARALFVDLVMAQQGSCSAFLDLGDHAICSASPELFFRRDGNEIVVRPMKGTTRRGRTIDEDEAMRAELLGSAKQQAENVMIVDMMRNDLGRIATVGSVSVSELFVAERYPGVWQMTSTVRARSRASLGDVIAALHPSASVTGAPKVRTMQLLAQIEAEPRGVYTGAIGYVTPDGEAQFNVAIRTAVVDRRAETVEFGVGSGVVWDSDADAEFEECLLKGRILGQRAETFELLETLRWTVDHGYFLRERHLDRLSRSADYFGFAFDRAGVEQALDEAVREATGARRVRLLMSREGTARVESIDLVRRREPLAVALAVAPVDSNDRFLYHKTTRRAMYDAARQLRPGFDEVLLWNERDEITEATIANVVVDLGAGRVTPPIACGLLGGTFRAELLDRGEITEAVVTREQLKTAREVWLVNSVHEWLPVRLEPW